MGPAGSHPTPVASLSHVVRYQHWPMGIWTLLRLQKPIFNYGTAFVETGFKVLSEGLYAVIWTVEVNRYLYLSTRLLINSVQADETDSGAPELDREFTSISKKVVKRLKAYQTVSLMALVQTSSGLPFATTFLKDMGPVYTSSSYLNVVRLSD